MNLFWAILLLSVVSTSASTESELLFEDMTARAGLTPHLTNWSLAHAAAWGDVNGDDRPDLYIGAFADRPEYGAPDAPIPNQLFIQTGDGFTLSDERAIRFAGKRARSTSAIFVDFDNDGDLDLLVGNNGPKPSQVQCTLFENDGHGGFHDVTPAAAPWPRPLAVRNVSSWDIDGDGLLDLIFTDGNYANWKGGGGRVIALRNKGGWAFEDVSEKFGFPSKGTAGMGLAVGDVNNDGTLDFFVADCNRLFVSGPQSRYSEYRTTPFGKPVGDPKSHACGAAFGDLNGDGLLDLVTTEHGQPASLHVYLNRGIQKGMPTFEQITDKAGLDGKFPKIGTNGVPVKTAHVSLQDFDNDGRIDIMLTVPYRDDRNRLQPVVLKNLGNTAGGIPRFSPPPMDRLCGYYAPGPVADYDRDGRLDLFLPAWFTNTPSVLFRNVSSGNGHWLTVRVVGKAKPFNAAGIGSTVRLYAAGHAGDPRHLLARRDIVIGTGYSSGEETTAHAGLGPVTLCDVEVTWGGKVVTQKNVSADQMVTLVFEP